MEHAGDQVGPASPSAGPILGLTHYPEAHPTSMGKCQWNFQAGLLTDSTQESGLIFGYKFSLRDPPSGLSVEHAGDQVGPAGPTVGLTHHPEARPTSVGKCQWKFQAGKTD